MGQAPERNFKNELLVAVVALVMLAITVVLASLLAKGSTFDAITTATTQSMSPTEISADLTSTATTVQASDTPKATATPTATVTEATEEETVQTTDTRQPSVTGTATIRPSRTPTRQASATASPTDRPTRTTLPSLTTAATATSTPPTKTMTYTPLPASSTPAAAATIALVTPQTPTGQACVPPANWEAYTIQAGDNLFRISLRSNVSLTEMQENNCISDPTRIEVGQVIYVPAYAAVSQPEDHQPGNEPGDRAEPAEHPPSSENNESDLPLRWGCSLPHVQITAPTAGRVQPLNAPFQVSGVATMPDVNDFDFYKVELRRENEVLFRNLVESTIPAISPVPLTVINPANFGAGHYQIVLTVVDKTGNYPEPCAVRVTFR